MIIFLDVDGVLNQLQLYKLIDSCISNLADICNFCDAHIVLTSSWRKGYVRDYDRCTPQVKFLIDRLNIWNIHITGRTKDLGDRYLEVQTYIKEHNIDKYIILDDDKSEFSIQDKNLYIVNPRTGLTSGDVKNIKKLYRRL